MRIDKFLKISRILKRRTVAQEACGAGKVLINGKGAKQSHKIKIGDVVEINYVSGTLKFEILQVKEVVKKDDAPTLYKISGDDDEKA
jgi:ribosomal 50S subunit-recycling heat shock protein